MTIVDVKVNKGHFGDQKIELSGGVQLMKCSLKCWLFSKKYWLQISAQHFS